MSKHVVRQSFNRAAGSYDSAATLQRRVCDLLLAELVDTAPGAILDAGCGTGYGLGLLAGRWPRARLLAADFAPAMLAAAGGGDGSGVCADIEALPFPPAAIDLYWSSLTWQWCDVRRTMAEAARVLRPGGQLAVSSLAPGTLAELASAFTGTDRHRHVLRFAPPEALTAACTAAGLVGPRIEQRSLRLHYPDLASLLRELKALGANQIGGPRRPGLLGRQAWRAIESRYEVHRDAAGLPATFEVILCTAHKPTS